MVTRRKHHDEEAQSEGSLFRMLQFLFLAAAFYGLAVYVVTSPPGLQTALYKLGNIAAGAYVGFWIDRRLVRKAFTTDSSDLEGIRRALIVGAAILAAGLGL